MMGQGGTFGYPLVTFVLHNLCKFLDASSQMNNQDLRVAALHISTVKQIVTHRLSGKGGEMGNEVIGGLLNVINKRKMEAS